MTESPLTEFNNAARPGGGDGELDINAGTYTALTNGHYTISYSGQAYTHQTEVISIREGLKKKWRKV